MDGDVAEENVEQLRISSIQNAGDLLRFMRRKLPGPVANLPKPEAPQKMGRRFFDDVDLFEWKFVRVLSLLCDDNRLNALKPGDLPVNVQHLRLEKRRAVKRDGGPSFRRRVQCLESNSPQDESARKADIEHEIKN